MKFNSKNRLILWSAFTAIFLAFTIVNFYGASQGRSLYSYIDQGIDNVKDTLSNIPDLEDFFANFSEEFADNYMEFNHDYNDSEYKTGNVFAPGNSINVIDLNWINGDIKVVESKSDNFEIVSYGNSTNDEVASKDEASQKMCYVIDNNKLVVWQNQNILKRNIFNSESDEVNLYDFISDLINNKKLNNVTKNFKNKDVVVAIPKNYKDTINIIINGPSSNVTFENVNLYESEINVNTASGDLKFKNYSGDFVSFNSISGNFKAENCNIHNLECNTTSGDINFDGFTSFFSVNSLSGDISAKIIPAQMNDDTLSFEANTTSGDIKLMLPKETEYTFEDIYSKYGKNEVNTNSTIDKKSNFNCELNIISISGDIVISK